MKRIILKTPKTAISMSRDELKSIVGGAETYLCQCTLLDNTSSQLENYNVTGGESGTSSPDNCETYCINQCKTYSGCSSYFINFEYTIDQFI